jgi:hypothetical protein
MSIGAKKTQNDLVKIQFSLPSDEWIIAVIQEGNDGRVIRETIPYRKLFSTKYVEWFRYKNANGCHIYGRPNSTRYVLIDDVTQEGVIRLKQGELNPTVIVETSPDKFHAWITVSKDELPIPVTTQLAKLLEQRYSIDTGSADSHHLGRLPGLRNKKPKYQTYPGDGGPLVLLRTALDVPKIPDGISSLIKEAELIVADRATCSPPPSTLLGGCDPKNFNLDMVNMSPNEGKEIYGAEVERQTKTFGSSPPTYLEDRSQLDYNVARGLNLKWNYPPEEIIAVLMYGSDKASERGMDYVIRTVKAARKSYC